MTFRFHPSARDEFKEAAAFYESRQPGLGAAFSIEIEATIARILESPNRWREIEAGVHTCRAHTFPYAVLYTTEPDGILILAVMHLHRMPGYWHDRQKGSD